MLSSAIRVGRTYVVWFPYVSPVWTCVVVVEDRVGSADIFKVLDTRNSWRKGPFRLNAGWFRLEVEEPE